LIGLHADYASIYIGTDACWPAAELLQRIMFE